MIRQIRQSDLEKLGRTFADLRACVLALSLPDSTDSINRAFDSAALDVAGVIKRTASPRFSILRFLASCGVRKAQEDVAAQLTRNALRRNAEKDN